MIAASIRDILAFHPHGYVMASKTAGMTKKIARPIFLVMIMFLLVTPTDASVMIRYIILYSYLTDKVYSKIFFSFAMGLTTVMTRLTR